MYIFLYVIIYINEYFDPIPPQWIGRLWDRIMLLDRYRNIYLYISIYECTIIYKPDPYPLLVGYGSCAGCRMMLLNRYAHRCMYLSVL